jgi:hypothetical protein
MAQSEGSDVRRAYDGPDIEHDQLIGFIEARNREDGERASSAGESRQMIGDFLEQTNMNAKALSTCRTIMKQKTTDKAMDIVRSLEAALPMLKAHLGGQQSEMDLDPSEPEFVDPDAELPDLPKPSYKPDFSPTGDADIDDETVAFEDNLAEVQA